MKDLSISKSSTEFTHEQLHEAILVAQDTLERCMVPFVLLDETAKQMMQELPTLSLSEISIGIMKNHWAESGRSMFRTLVPKAEITNVNVTYNHGNGVPILMWIIEGDYQFFKNPDMRFYYGTEFMLPNPFKDYWKSRDYIK